MMDLGIFWSPRSARYGGAGSLCLFPKSFSWDTETLVQMYCRSMLHVAGFFSRTERKWSTCRPSRATHAHNTSCEPMILLRNMSKGSIRRSKQARQAMRLEQRCYTPTILLLFQLVAHAKFSSLMVDFDYSSKRCEVWKMDANAFQKAHSNAVYTYKQ